MLSVVYTECPKLTLYAKCVYAESHSECCGTKAIYKGFKMIFDVNHYPPSFTVLALRADIINLFIPV